MPTAKVLSENPDNFHFLTLTYEAHSWVAQALDMLQECNKTKCELKIQVAIFSANFLFTVITCCVCQITRYSKDVQLIFHSLQHDIEMVSH